MLLKHIYDDIENKVLIFEMHLLMQELIFLSVDTWFQHLLESDLRNK